MKRLLVTTAIVTGAMFFHPTARADILSAQSYFDGGATTTLTSVRAAARLDPIAVLAASNDAIASLRMSIRSSLHARL